MAPKKLPALMDRRMIHEETGLPLATCETLMRRCALIQPGGIRRIFVRREEVFRLIEAGSIPSARATAGRRRLH